jgi:hypothetical protein
MHSKITASYPYADLAPLCKVKLSANTSLIKLYGYNAGTAEATAVYKRQ